MTSCATPRSDGANASMRRGACPSLAKPMQTGDGLLVRLRPATGSLTPAELRVLAVAAERFGNGILEVTARGNLQVRGLTAADVAGLASAIGEAGIGVAEGVAIETPPLAGVDTDEIIDPRPLALALREAITALDSPLKLAPKLSIIIDGGGRFHLDNIVADLRLKAVKTDDDVAWLLSLGGTARPVALLDHRKVVPGLLAVLRRLATMGDAARGRDLDLEVIKTELAGGAYQPTGLILATEPAMPVAGLHTLADGATVLGVGLAYAQADAASLTALLRKAEELAAAEIRLAPGHGLFVLGLDHEAAAIMQGLAFSLGFRIAPDDPRNHIATCAGTGACASALMETKAVARVVVDAAPELLDGSLTVHLSGCPKGCARPSSAELTLVGAPSGYALVVNGTASVAPSAYTDANGIKSAFAHLGALVRENKDAGESARSCLTRLGAARIAAAFEQG
ncbi:MULTISPECIES: precorrin-3B synthase [unclassified Sinorhizobium]|uniref:precorrin-3B synthase n=1 Tax=unclassified Sinorhizobium TaxID=2613772 RepID=UPI0024C2289A|nr:MULTISPECIES: precorrin-3B synthase [unclassified Sinorhizobium]MDK1375407.1 precorrin-3B synthase [Sinorhizobium sp. 6-70]MDK1477925.1 precorrin-3B synthase [Sinorhizobium sp. 6-117]